MPSRPASLCPRSGCPGLVRDGVCAACGHDSNQQRRTRYDNQRGNAAERGYDYRWRKLRGMVLRHTPLCADCAAEGRTTQATEVHHIVARRDGGQDEESNLMALCKSCHSKRTNAGE